MKNLSISNEHVINVKRSLCTHNKPHMRLDQIRNDTAKRPHYDSNECDIDRIALIMHFWFTY